MAHDVFISYSSADRPVAEAACAALEHRGIRCWIAPRDILPGLDWGAAIIKAIEGCRVMVLVFSRNANRSGQIKREVERAVAKGVTLVPIRIENALPEKTLEYFISSAHWLDAWTPPMEKHLERLAETVHLLLTRTTRDSVESVVPASKTPPAIPSVQPVPLPAPLPLPAPAPSSARSARFYLLAAAGVLACFAVLSFTRRGSPPEIVALDFPTSVTAGSRTSGSLQFRDLQGDIVSARFAVVEAQEFEPMTLDPRVQGRTAGRFAFALRSPVPQRVTLEATLVDARGRKSDPFRFSFEAKASRSQRRWTIDTPRFRIGIR